MMENTNETPDEIIMDAPSETSQLFYAVSTSDPITIIGTDDPIVHSKENTKTKLVLFISLYYYMYVSVYHSLFCLITVTIMTILQSLSVHQQKHDVSVTLVI